MKKVWERDSHAFPPHYTPAGYTINETIPKPQTCDYKIPWAWQDWIILFAANNIILTELNLVICTIFKKLVRAFHVTIVQLGR